MSRRAYSATMPFFLAQNEADTRLVVLMAKQIIDGGKIEVHFSGIFRFECATFQIEDHEASKLQVIEEKIDSVVRACDLKGYLPANEREADSQLKEKFLDVAYKAGLYVSFVSILGEREEIEIIRIFEELLGEIGLRLWKRGLRIGGRLPLATVKVALDLHDEDVPAPAVLDGSLDIPEAFVSVLELV